MQTIREKMIDAIIELAGDEIKSPQDVWKYAKMSEEQLILQLISIAEYYRSNS